MGMFSIGRVTGAISTSIRKKVEEHKEQQEFNKEYDIKLKEARRDEKLKAIPKIAKAEADIKVKQAKRGTVPKKKGVFERVTGEKFFISPKNTGGSRERQRQPRDSHPWETEGMGGGGGMSDADREFMGLDKKKRKR